MRSFSAPQRCGGVDKMGGGGILFEVSRSMRRRARPGFFPRFYSSMNLGGTVSFIPSESLEGRKECDSTVLNANVIGFGLRGHRTLKRAPKEWNTVYKENRQSALSAPTAVKTHQLKPSSSNVRLAQPDYILSTRAPTPEGLVNLKGPQNIKRFPSVPYIGEKHDDPALLHPNLLDLPGLEGVYVVSNEVSAAASMEKILQLGDDVWFAVDTEVADIDVKKVGPIGNGRVICLSVYAGPSVDLGGGPGKVLWIDNMDEAEDVLLHFKPFLESTRHRKVWHNYGFDRHVLYNTWGDQERRRINCLGFGGDTMHMARLWDTSLTKLSGEGGFSLQALSSLLLGRSYEKVSMKDLFGVSKLRKDGTPGNIMTMPPVEELQRSKHSRENWIRYSSYDAQSTWLIRKELEAKLRAVEWRTMSGNILTMWDFYKRYYVSFGEILTDMEREGIYVNATGYLAEVEKQARLDQSSAVETFKSWVAEMQPEAADINPSSSAQIQCLLFGGSENIREKGQALESVRTFQIERDPMELEQLMSALDKYASMTLPELKDACRSRSLKVSGTKAELQDRLRNPEPESVSTKKSKVGTCFSSMKVSDLRDTCAARGLNIEGTKSELVSRLKDDSLFQLQLQQLQYNKTNECEQKVKIVAPKPPSKYKDLIIRSIGLKPFKHTASGWPAVSMDVLRKLAGDFTCDPPKYGTAYKEFGGNTSGDKACRALDALCRMGSIDTMLSNFLVPLQSLVDARSRVHCSLNINTDTGRLSARRPNLQNQPALEKDQYRIRSAFAAEAGKSLIVADYGQLELRLLAHMSDCKSMIDAFEQGGCFHSRTAVGMFDHVRKAVSEGDVLLEWDTVGEGKAPPKPLVKEAFASERRKAKVLNFSIAYGKTAHGLSKDWGVSTKEAEDLLEAWYQDRPEVRRWQHNVIKEAQKTKHTRTLMGRRRKLPDITSIDRSRRGHMERAAINTPIQGGAADVAMSAMIKLVNDKELRRMGWKLLLQIHDEVIFEGPEETAEEAEAIIVHIMENPWDELGMLPLKVKLTVDSSHAPNWYLAK